MLLTDMTLRQRIRHARQEIEFAQAAHQFFHLSYDVHCMEMEYEVDSKIFGGAHPTKLGMYLIALLDELSWLLALGLFVVVGRVPRWMEEDYCPTGWAGAGEV